MNELSLSTVAFSWADPDEVVVPDELSMELAAFALVGAPWSGVEKLMAILGAGVISIKQAWVK